MENPHPAFKFRTNPRGKKWGPLGKTWEFWGGGETKERVVFLVDCTGTGGLGGGKDWTMRGICDQTSFSPEGRARGGGGVMGSVY